MSNPDLTDEIVELLRDAELDESVWARASALVDESCGLRGNDLLLARHSPQGGIDVYLRWLFLRGERNPQLEREYIEDYARIDERPAALPGSPTGEIIHTNSLLSDKVRRKSVTYNEWLVPNAGENCLNVGMPVRGDLAMAWSLVGPGGGDPCDWTSEQVDRIRRLLPHVRQFIRVRWALAEARADGMDALALLDTRRLGVLLLDRKGHILEANERALALLTSDTSLTDRGGRLSADWPADRSRVDRLLEAACSGRRGGSVPIVQLSDPPLVLYATPTSDPVPVFGKRCAARILIAEPFSASPVNADRVCAALGLTPAQGRVAAALAAGGTAASIAAAMHRTEAAVRWNIREALQRLGLSRQTDLVRVVLSTPGVFDDYD